MKQPRTPTGQGVSLKREGSKGPRTPSANRLASQQQQARLERGETAAASAPFSQSTRAWRTGGDRKIMFENRAGHALIPEARRPVSLVAGLNVCAWLLVATGLFQIVISKLSKFQWPLHWVGVLMIFLGVVSMGVRVFTNRCGTSPNWVAAVAVVTIVACLTAWLVADGPLYAEVKPATSCTDEGVPSFCPEYDCVCQTESNDSPLCVHFWASCEYVTSNRRYLVMSLFSSWVGIGLSFVVAVLSVKVSLDTYDPGAVMKAEEKKKMKEKKVAVAGDPPAVPFGA